VALCNRDTIRIVTLSFQYPYLGCAAAWVAVRVCTLAPATGEGALSTDRAVGEEAVDADASIPAHVFCQHKQEATS